MKKIILILTMLFASLTFGQTDPLWKYGGLFANINGNLFDVNRLSFLSSDDLTMSVISGRFTLTQTGAQVQTILDGTYTSTLTVGVDDTGHDVKFFGATAGQFLLWDESNDQLIFPQKDDATTPTLAFGDGNTGFYETADNVLYLSIAGTRTWQFSSTTFGRRLTDGGAIMNVTSSATVPSITSSHADGNTGLGWAGADSLTLIAGAVDVMSLGKVGIQVNIAMVMGAPTGGLKGAGTLNAGAVYDDNTILTGDYVFASDYNALTIKEMSYFYERKRHLPWLTSQAEMIEVGNISLGERLNETIVALENQAMYIVELEKRLAKLEK